MFIRQIIDLWVQYIYGFFIHNLSRLESTWEFCLAVCGLPIEVGRNFRPKLHKFTQVCTAFLGGIRLARQNAVLTVPAPRNDAKSKFQKNQNVNCKWNEAKQKSVRATSKNDKNVSWSLRSWKEKTLQNYGSRIFFCQPPKLTLLFFCPQEFTLLFFCQMPTKLPKLQPSDTASRKVRDTASRNHAQGSRIFYAYSFLASGVHSNLFGFWSEGKKRPSKSSKSNLLLLWSSQKRGPKVVKELLTRPSKS